MKRFAGKQRWVHINDLAAAARDAKPGDELCVHGEPAEMADSSESTPLDVDHIAGLYGHYSGAQGEWTFSPWELTQFARTLLHDAALANEEDDSAGSGPVRASPSSGPHDRLDGDGQHDEGREDHAQVQPAHQPSDQRAEADAADQPPVNELVAMYELAQTDPLAATARLRQALEDGRYPDGTLLALLDMIDELRKRQS